MKNKNPRTLRCFCSLLANSLIVVVITVYRWRAYKAIIPIGVPVIIFVEMVVVVRRIPCSFLVLIGVIGRSIVGVGYGLCVIGVCLAVVTYRLRCFGVCIVIVGVASLGKIV